MSHEIALQISHDPWLTWYTIDEWQDRIQSIIEGTLKAINWRHSSEISVLLADNIYSRELNHSYRGKDSPTNVLSFPAMTREELEKVSYKQPPIILGDIVLALEVVLQEAEEQKKRFLDHITHLIIHGTLHLLGYDHVEDAEADAMEALEISILENLGISDPYQ